MSFLPPFLWSNFSLLSPLFLLDLVETNLARGSDHKCFFIAIILYQYLFPFSFLFDTIIRDSSRNFLVQKFISTDWVIFFLLSSLNGPKNQRTSLLRTIYFLFSFFYIFLIRIVRARFSPGGFVNKLRTRRIILRENLKRLSRQKVFEHRPRISHFFPRGGGGGKRERAIANVISFIAPLWRDRRFSFRKSSSILFYSRLSLHSFLVVSSTKLYREENMVLRFACLLVR